MSRSSLVLVLVGCSPDGGGGPAATGGVTLREVGFFQAVEVPVYEDGVEVALADRNAPLVADRDAIVRAMVDVSAEWTTAEVTLAVEVDAAGPARTFSATRTIAASSVDDDPDSGLVASIPADAMVAGAEYAVSLLDGSSVISRFPSSGTRPWTLVETGRLKVKLVPFDVDGFVPDTSAAVVEGYRAALLATYPVTEVEITVGETEPWTAEFDLGAINVELGRLQEEAMVAGEVGWDVYFYGMVTGVATRDEYEGATGTSEDGGGDPVRAYFATGAAFGDQTSEDTLIHELGHVHGLEHAPCDGEDDVDPAFPYVDGTVGVEGYDVRTASFVPPDTMDMMTYCYPRWISDYDYAKIAPHVAAAQDFPGLR